MNLLKQRGISLVELMVSITVGLVLMAGVVQLFLASKVTFNSQSAIARVQETGRLAMDFIAEDLRMAGYMGCADFSVTRLDNHLKDTTALIYRFESPIEGVDEGITDKSYPAGRLSSTDALILRSANSNTMGLQGTNTADRIYIENTDFEEKACPNDKDKYSGFCEGDIVVVASCSKGIVFQATKFEFANKLPTDDLSETTPQETTQQEGDEETAGKNAKYIAIYHEAIDGFKPGNIKAEWEVEQGSESFGGDSQLLRVNTAFYYIANNTASGRPGLFREVNGDVQELMTGVEDMQLKYGRDTNNDRAPDEFVDAKDIPASDWNKVTAIKVELLVVSTDDNVLDEPQKYTFNGSLVSAKDRRMRQVFTSTIAIRGRMP
ncbi:PilW family protein [Microbulbifer sp. TRSA005]|uniref:PilW family protein n=1 Tax=unclassified Microbulbifer TaxID=2619833 RepID=UPI0040393C09